MYESSKDDNRERYEYLRVIILHDYLFDRCKAEGSVGH
jgi:hypothetical protein